MRRILFGFPVILRFCLGKLVAALVEGIAGMPLDPLEGDPVLLAEGVKLQPKLLVFYVTACCGFPAVSFPVGDPVLGESIFEILAVGVKLRCCWGSEMGERGDGGSQFHAVVGRAGFSAVQSRDVSRGTFLDDGSPSAGAVRIFEAGAVRIDDVVDRRWDSFAGSGGRLTYLSGRQFAGRWRS